MPDISQIPHGTRIETRVRGVLVDKPELGGAGAMELDGRRGWYRRIDEVETVVVLVDEAAALAMPEIDDRVLYALPMIAAGARTAEIARHIHEGVHNVEKLLTRAMRAWGARNRAHLVAIAYQNGILPVCGGGRG